MRAWFDLLLLALGWRNRATQESVPEIFLDGPGADAENEEDALVQ